MFGHRKGAFTGALQDREGAAALADGGTLFLDELCEMDLDLQAKLLRFIQTGSYRRVGDGTDRQVDIRFVCATNRDPLTEVAAGRFREDLYYRLHVVPITMPPLRDRGTDISLLANRFLKSFAKIERKDFKRFDMSAMAVVEGYAWPGNVRQLENFVRNVVVLNNGEVVTQDMLPPCQPDLAWRCRFPTQFHNRRQRGAMHLRPHPMLLRKTAWLAGEAPLTGRPTAGLSALWKSWRSWRSTRRSVILMVTFPKRHAL